MSVTNDNTIVRLRQRQASMLLQSLAIAERCNCWPVRAVVRALVSIPVGALSGSVSELLSDANANNALVWVFAAASAAAIIAMLRWSARREGSLGQAIKLTLVSYGFLQSLVSAALTLWTAIGMDGPPNWAFVGFTTLISLALFIPTAVYLTRHDPD